MMNPVERFFAAVGQRDATALAEVIHPDFEMIVPQRPARGFKGKQQEVDNMRSLFEAHPDLAMTLLRSSSRDDEIWTEAELRSSRLHMMAVVIWKIDRTTCMILSGRYYSEPVQHETGDIDSFMRAITRPRV